MLELAILFEITKIFEPLETLLKKQGKILKESFSYDQVVTAIICLF